MPKSASHLISYQFQPGNKANPGGKTKSSITVYLNKYLEMDIHELHAVAQKVESREDSMTAKELMAFRMVVSAVVHLKESHIDRVLMYTDGPPVKQVPETPEAREKLKELEDILRGVTSMNANENTRPY